MAVPVWTLRHKDGQPSSAIIMWSTWITIKATSINTQMVEVVQSAGAFAELGPRRRGYCIADNWLVRGASNTAHSVNGPRDRERASFVHV